MINWDKFPNFQESEFDCTATGANEMREEFLELLQKIRNHYGRPMFITSGYRDVTHPIEVLKDEPGEHTLGLAADISATGMQALELVVICHKLGVRRVGIMQRDNMRFIHIGIGDRYGFPEAFWSY